jgi:hypothetical protein
MTDSTATSLAPLRGVAWDFRRWARTIVFVLFAAHIWFGPYAVQILEIRNPLFRPWTMFSGIGVGILKGEFHAVGRNGSVRTLTPLQMLGLDRYPVMRSTQFPMRVIEPGDLRKFTASYCELHDPKLSFTGFVGTRTGWRALSAADICAWPPDDAN